MKKIINKNDEKLEAVCQYAKPQSAEQMKILEENLDLFDFVPGVSNAEEYGKYMIRDSGHYDYDPELDEYIDFERYGRERKSYYNGSFTELGYVGYSGIEPLERLMGNEQDQELKLYMPLTADLFERNEWGDYDDDYIELYGADLCEYEDNIARAMEKCCMPEEKERGLMTWYGRKNSLDSKVKSAFFAVENRAGQLWGVVKCRIADELTEAELGALKYYITGQASDGWGEGFEQQAIRIEDGSELNVHLWHSSITWEIQTEEELFGQAHDMNMKF